MKITKSMLNFYTDCSKRIVKKLIENNFFDKIIEVEEITVLEKDICVKLSNCDKTINIPKKSMGNERDEDLFVYNLISKS